MHPISRLRFERETSEHEAGVLPEVSSRHNNTAFIYNIRRQSTAPCVSSAEEENAIPKIRGENVSYTVGKTKI
jgi:hypothetical protein